MIGSPKYTSSITLTNFNNAGKVPKALSRLQASVK